MGGNLVVNILDKISSYAEANVQINAQILVATKKSNEILSKQIHNELKKHTGLLEKLIKATGKSGSTSFSLFGGGGKMVKKLAAFLTEISPKKIDAMGKSVGTLANSITKFVESINKLDEKKLTLVSMFFTKMSKGIALFAITVALSAPLLIIGTIVTLPLILLWGAAFNFLGKYEKQITSGAKTIFKMGVAVAVLALAVAGFIFINGGVAGSVINSATVAFSLFILTLPMIFIAKRSKNLTKAAIGIAVMSLAIYLLGLGIESFFKSLGAAASDPMAALISVGIAALAIAVIGGVMFVMGKIMKPIIKGALAMIVAGVAVVIIAKSVQMFMKAKATKEDMGLLGLVIVGIGAAMAVAGAGPVPGFILAGAAAMIVAGVAVVIIAKSIQMYMKAKATKEDMGLLGVTIVGLAAAMTLIGNPFTIAFTLAGAGALVVMGAGLVLFTKSLEQYKKAAWTDADSTTLMFAMKTILKGFIKIFDDIDSEDIDKAIKGTELLGDLGNSMSQFAEGVAAMAKLQVPTYAVKKGKLVLVGTKPLDPNFAQQVGENIANMLNAVIDPLKKLGENEGMFFDGAIGKGVDLLGRLGNSLSQFALGVQAMANLQVPTYEVKKGKLVLKSTEPISPTFATDLGTNIGMMTDALILPMKRLGEQEGMFFSGAVGKGVDLLGRLGNSLASFALGVQAMANLQVPVYEVKKGQLVLKDTKPMDADFTKNVKKNIQKLVKALTGPIELLGTKSGTFFNSNFETGLKMLGKLSKPISQIGEGVKAFAAMSVGGFSGRKMAKEIGYFVNGIQAAFSKNSGYDDSSERNMKQFGTYLTWIYAAFAKDVKEKPTQAVGNAINIISKAVNELDMNKLIQLNRFMDKFTLMAKTLGKQFDNIEDTLKMLRNIIEELSSLQENTLVSFEKYGGLLPGANDSSNQSTGNALSNTEEGGKIDDIVSSLEDLQVILLGTLDVRVEDNLING